MACTGSEVPISANEARAELERRQRGEVLAGGLVVPELIDRVEPIRSAPGHAQGKPQGQAQGQGGQPELPRGDADRAQARRGDDAHNEQDHGGDGARPEHGSKIG
jgi:hypothetical protein